MTANVREASRGMCPVLVGYLYVIEHARWSCDAARAEMLRPWRLRLEESRSTPEVAYARAQWLAHRALTWWAPLAGMAAVMALEEDGVDCAEMRAAYGALLALPSEAKVEQAEAAAAARRAAAFALRDAPGVFACSAARDAADSAEFAVHGAVLGPEIGEYVSDDAGAAACAAAEAARHTSYAARDAVLRMAVEDLGELLAITEAAGESEGVREAT